LKTAADSVEPLFRQLAELTAGYIDREELADIIIEGVKRLPDTVAEDKSEPRVIGFGEP
jgi:hypothetical protein